MPARSSHPLAASRPVRKAHNRRLSRSRSTSSCRKSCPCRSCRRHRRAKVRPLASLFPYCLARRRQPVAKAQSDKAFHRRRCPPDKSSVEPNRVFVRRPCKRQVQSTMRPARTRGACRLRLRRWTARPLRLALRFAMTWNVAPTSIRLLLLRINTNDASGGRVAQRRTNTAARCGDAVDAASGSMLTHRGVDRISEIVLA